MANIWLPAGLALSSGRVRLAGFCLSKYVLLRCFAVLVASKAVGSVSPHFNCLKLNVLSYWK